MSHLLHLRPRPGDCAPYYDRYLALLPDGGLDDILETQWEELCALLDGLDDDAARHRYAEGKWSIKEVLGHLVDAERIFAYRILCLARGERAALPGFDEDAYVAAADFDARPLESLLEDYDLVRGHTLALLRSLDERSLGNRGTSNGQPVSCLALAAILAGHERHHVQLLRERYLAKG